MINDLQGIMRIVAWRGYLELCILSGFDGAIMNMLKTISFVLLSLFCIFSYTSISHAADDELYVKVRKVKLFARPSYLSNSVSTLKYADSVKKLSEEQGWYKVQTKTNLSGYVHSSAFSEKKIVLGSLKDSPGVTADKSEVVLAGKGFNPEVEKSYAQRNKTLNFSAVDSIDRYFVSDKELSLFIREGKLSREG